MKVFIISSATARETNRAGTHKIFALLCSRANLAKSGCQQRAARISLCLLAVIATPLPLPQIKIPHPASPLSTALATGWAKSG